jgi:ATP-binding cassette subfamily B protein
MSILVPPTTELRGVARTVAWALAMAWRTNPRATLALGAIAVLVGVQAAALAITTRGIINAGAMAVQGQADAFNLMLPWLAAAFVVAVLEAVTPLTNRLVIQMLSDDLNLAVAADILGHAADLDLASLEDPTLRDTIESAQQDTAAAFARLVTGVQAICTDASQVMFLIAVLTYLEPLVLVVVGPLGLPYLIVRWRTAKLRTSEDLAWTRRRRWSRYFALHLTGQTAPAETKVLGLGPLFLTKFRALMTQFRERDRHRYRRDFVQSVIFATLTTLAFFLLFARVALRVSHNALTVGDIAVFAGVSARVRLTLERLIGSLSGLAEQAVWVANVRAFMQMPPRIASGGTVRPATRHGSVEVLGVSFTYPHASTPAVSDVSLRFEPGEIVALVGENGAGKTTLVRLIARLYDPDRGQIRLDGVDLRHWPLDELHRSIAFLDQRFARYESTAAENIAYGDWRRLLDRADQVREIAIAAGVDQLIRSLPQGYDTALGPLFGGHDLSAGQWQKLAVARALARDAELLIVDEPTANLDAAAEYEFFVRLRDLAKGRTTILVSHRFTTLSAADRIVVMERGRVVESGTHEALLARGAVYARLYDLHRRQTTLATRS